MGTSVSKKAKYYTTKIQLSLGVGCLLFLGLISQTSLVYSQEITPINVALNIPLSGPLAYYGQSIQEGIAIASDEENKKLVNFDFQDNEGKAKVAVSIANSQLLKAPNIYVSGVKPQLMAIKEIIAKRDIPHFQFVFDVNIRPNGEANNFRTWVNFKEEPEVFIHFAKEIKPKKIAIVYVSLPHTNEEYQQLIIPGLKLKGVEDVYVQPYQMDLTDFGAIALNVRAYKPDLLIISGFAENLAVMTRRLYEQGLIKDKNVIATYDLIDALNLVRPEWVEGVRVSAPLFLTRKDEDLKIKNWFNTFKERYNKEPNYTDAYAYDMAKIFFEAARRKAQNQQKSLTEIIQEIDMPGLTTQLKFDKYGSLPISIERGVVRGGGLYRDVD